MGVKIIFYATEGYFLNIENFDRTIGSPLHEKLPINKYLIWNRNHYERAKVIINDKNNIKKIHCDRL